MVPERQVASMDVLFPRLAEVIGGGQREERLDRLLPAMESNGLATAADGDYNWYIDLRRWGSVPHSGFGANVKHHPM